MFLLSLFPIIFHGTAGNISEITDATCDSPTEDYVVGVVLGKFEYNVSDLHLSKNTCVSLTFVNQNDVNHSLVIWDENNQEWASLWAINSVDQGIATHSYRTPDQDVTYIAFCKIPGHKELGMKFNVYIGTGTPSTNSDESGTSSSGKLQNETATSEKSINTTPGFELGILLIFIALPYVKEKRK